MSKTVTIEAHKFMFRVPLLQELIQLHPDVERSFTMDDMITRSMGEAAFYGSELQFYLGMIAGGWNIRRDDMCAMIVLHPNKREFIHPSFIASDHSINNVEYVKSAFSGNTVIVFADKCPDDDTIRVIISDEDFFAALAPSYLKIAGYDRAKVETL